MVEKAVETMPKEQFEKVCVVFMKNSSKKSKLYREIMLDSYGNYIAPKILERAKVFTLQHQFDYFNKVSNSSLYHNWSLTHTHSSLFLGLPRQH